MKEISQLNLPEDLFYTKEHEWVRKEGDNIVVGITDYAQDQLGDIVFVEVPEAGDSFDRDEEFGTLESVKAVSEIFMPVAGEIVEVNESLEDTPENVNSDPYGNGWLVKMKPENFSDVDALMNKEAYLTALKG